MAPLSPEWSFRQTETTLTADVKVRGVSKKACDIFLSDRFLKVNAPPYLLALDLWGEIDEERSTATVSQGSVTVHMRKAEPGAWDNLHVPLGDRSTRAEVLERRKESIERAHRKLEQRRLEKVALKEREKQEAQDRSLELDRKKRQAIDDAKEQELRDARQEISAFKSKTRAPPSPLPGSDPREEMRRALGAADTDSEDDEGDSVADLAMATDSEGEVADDVDQENQEGEEEEDCEEEDEIVILPPPRETMPSVEVEFTPTIVDNLPAREGREEELKLIRRSQGKADVQDDGEETDLTERHPVFLKDKGDKMSKHGNFKGALRAYSRALDLDPNHLLCLCNRSMCYLRLGEAALAEADCRRAIEMIEGGKASTSAPELGDVDKKAVLRIKMSGRLAKALAAQDRTKEVIEELETALKLSGRYPEIQTSIQRDLDDALACERVSFEGDWNQLTDLSAAKLKPKIESIKKLADMRIKQQDPKGALRVYAQIADFISEVQERCDVSSFQLVDREFLLEMKLACFSNSASAHLMLGDYVSSIESCKGAILVVATLFKLYFDVPEIEKNDREVDSLIQMTTRLLELSKGTPSSNSRLFQGKREKYVLSLARILRRMSFAYSHLKEYKEGLKILQLGLTLTQSSAELGGMATEITKDLRVLQEHTVK